ncbi:MAG: sigma-70 family RNA polymerase sigma factor [Planctomycetota bacterium]
MKQNKTSSPPVKAHADDSSNDSALTRKEWLLSALDQYESRLTAYANRMLGGDLDQARDVVQFAFLKLCEQDIDQIATKLAAWLFTVVRNRILDQKRRASSQDESLDFDCRDQNSIDPAEQAEKVEFLRRLRRLMDHLPESQREIIDLWSHGFRTREISEITGIEPGTVRVRMHRAIKTLQQKPLVAKWLIESKTDSTSSQTRFSLSESESLKPDRATGFDAMPGDRDSSPPNPPLGMPRTASNQMNGKKYSSAPLPGRPS